MWFTTSKGAAAADKKSAPLKPKPSKSASTLNTQRNLFGEEDMSAPGHLDTYDYESELRDLGFTDPSPAVHAANSTAPRSNNASRAQGREQISAPISQAPPVYDFGEIDESAIEVSEEDMNNPEYFALMEEGESNEEEVTEPSLIHSEASNVESDSSPPELKVEEGEESLVNKVARLKKEAVALSGRGDKAEAIARLREARLLETQNGLEVRVQEVRDIATTVSSSSLREEKKEEVIASLPSYSAQMSIATTINREEEVPYGPPGKARERAVELKREGRLEEALQWIRYAKKEEEKNSRIGTNALPTSSTMKAYEALEQSLKEARKLAFDKARALRETNASEAANQMRMLKKFEEDLRKVNEYKQLVRAPPPPAFKWTIRKIVVPPKINSEIGDDGFHLHIGRLISFQSVLSKYIGCTLSVKYNLSLPIDSPIVGETARVKVEASNVSSLNFNASIRATVPRRKSFSTSLLRKKAHFDLVLHKGGLSFLLSRDEVIGVVLLPLAKLITQISCGGDDVAITSPESVEKAIGGALGVSISIRSPYGRNEASVAVTEEERVLEVGAWPPLPQTEELPQSSKASTASETMRPQVSAAISGEPIASRDGAASSKQINKYDVLSVKEREDPLAVEFYISNDALEAEIERLEAQLSNDDKTLKKEQEEEDFLNLKLRRDLLQVQLSVLVAKVQREELSIENYVATLRYRSQQDGLLVQYCKSHGKSKEAALVQSRLEIMLKEIESAAAAM